MSEPKHIAFWDQPVTEIDSFDGKVVPVDVDKARSFGMDEIERRGHARPIPDNQGDEKHKRPDPPGSMVIACGAAHQIYPVRNSSMPARSHKWQCTHSPGGFFLTRISSHPKTADY